MNPFDDIASLMPNYENEPGKQDRIFAGTDKQGRGIYVRNPFGKVGEEFKNWITAPGTQLMSKLSTIARPMVDVLKNDYFGHHVFDTDGSMTQDIHALGQIIGHIMASQVPLTAVQGGYDLVSGAPEPGASLSKSVIPFATGVTVSCGSPLGPQGAVEQEAYKRHEEMFYSVYPKAVDAIKRGNTADAVRMLEGIGESKGQIEGVIKGVLNPQAKTLPKGRLFKDFEQYAKPQDMERIENVNR